MNLFIDYSVQQSHTAQASQLEIHVQKIKNLNYCFHNLDMIIH